METPVINGVSHRWGSIKMIIMGQLITGVTEISYKESQDIEANYASGEKPYSIGYGQVKFSGSITLHKSVVENLQNVAPNRRLQEIPPFPITVAYTANGQTVTHKLLFCVFMDNTRESKAGDKKIEVKLPLFIGDIKW